jgi:hypothetical protein
MKITIILITLLLFPFILYSENANTLDTTNNTLTLLVGAGYNRHINDLVNLPADARVHSNRYATSLKVF